MQAFLGIKVLMTCFNAQLTLEWPRVARCIREISDRVDGGPSFWNFLVFVATQRGPLYLLILPLMWNKVFTCFNFISVLLITELLIAACRYRWRSTAKTSRSCRSFCARSWPARRVLLLCRLASSWKSFTPSWTFSATNSFTREKVHLPMTIFLSTNFSAIHWIISLTILRINQ